ncbi:MAG TPA: crotonase/enoyl-CoA hydratase family protein [Mycobacteriales bacterium]|nr:crotonase/enoyl-CoA hydratase family protein [Mycobacteriales bacterium]
MTVDEVRYERRGAAALVTIDRQHRRNAIDGKTADALVEALDDFEADEFARVMVLTGAGSAFCAGADLTAIETLEPRLRRGEGPLGFTRRVAAKPTIAAIDGWAVAGGLELAAWCDIRIASPRAQFGCLERRFGVPLIDGGTWRLPRIVGFGRAMDLVLTGRLVDSAEALAIGLVTAVVEDPVGHALAMAEQLATYPQETMLSDRRSMYDGYGHPLDEALDIEARYGREVLLVGREGAKRFAGGEGRGAAGV